MQAPTSARKYRRSVEHLRRARAFRALTVRLNLHDTLSCIITRDEMIYVGRGGERENSRFSEIPSRRLYASVSRPFNDGDSLVFSCHSAGFRRLEGTTTRGPLGGPQPRETAARRSIDQVRTWRVRAIFLPSEFPNSMRALC